MRRGGGLAWRRRVLLHGFLRQGVNCNTGINRVTKAKKSKLGLDPLDIMTFF